MILATAVPSTGVSENQNPDSLSGLSGLDDITFWVVDIESGSILDKKTYYADYIFLSFNAGVHMYNEYLSITSVQNQCLYIHLIKDSGKLIPGLKLGWLLHPDDDLILSMHRKQAFDCAKTQNLTSNLHQNSTNGSARVRYVSNGEMISSSTEPFNLILNSDSSQPDTFSEFKPLSGIKQRMMSFLYQKAAKNGPKALSHFYLTFSYFSSLVMWRMQFIDSDNILVKFGPLSNITSVKITLN